MVEDGHCLRGYAPKGKTPVLATPSRRSGLALVSAIRNLGLVRFRFIEQAMNANLLIEFLGQLIADSPQVFLILDNLKVHHAKAVTRWVGEHPERIELFYLPPYTPSAIRPNTSTGISKRTCGYQRVLLHSKPYGKKPRASCNSLATRQSRSGSISTTLLSTTLFIVMGNNFYNSYF